MQFQVFIDSILQVNSLKGKEKARNLFSYLFFNKIILKLSQFITIM